MAFLSAQHTVPQISRARLKRMLSAGNRLTLLIGVWALFWPRPYFLLIAFCFVLPLVALATELRFRGIVDWEESRRKASPFSVATIATMPALALFIRAGTDLNILDWRSMIAWSAFGAIGIAGAICSLDTRVRGSLNQLAQIALFAIAYSYGALALSNVVVDPHRASESRTQVTAMRVHVSGGSKGNSIWHEIKVDPSASPTGAAWIHIRPDIYAQLHKGDAVCVRSGRGLLAVRWFDIRLCPPD